MRKIALIFRLVLGLLIGTPVLAQTIRLSVKEVSLPVVFKELQQQTPYRFIYSNEVLEGTKPVTLSISTDRLEALLPLLFKNQPLEYTIEDHYVVLKRKEAIQSDRTVSRQEDIRGVVQNEQGEPLAGATITVKGTGKATATNERGPLF